MFNRKMMAAIITGILLGIICIIGAGIRKGFSGNQLFLLAMFYNRFIMGIVVGLATTNKGKTVLYRGAFLGFLVSLAFYLSTEFQDPVAFAVGIFYGVIIAAVARRYTGSKSR